MLYHFRRYDKYENTPGCTSMLECVAKGEGCPMYSKLIVSVLMALLLYSVFELIAEQLVKNKYTTFGDVMVVTVDDNTRHEYETKMWVKLFNLMVGAVTFMIVYNHLSKNT